MKPLLTATPSSRPWSRAARRELKGTERDTPEERQAIKAELWARLDARLSTWDPNAETMAQWALHAERPPGPSQRVA